MKKLLSTFLVVAAFATAFSCSKIEKDEPVAGEVHTVSFNAISPASKTTFGTLNEGKFPTYWTVNDSEVKVAQNFSDGIDASVTKNSDTNASFTASFTDDGSGSYTFYAVSPASAVVSGVSSKYYSWNLEIPITQTSTATGPDEAAMILAATSSSSGSFPASVDLTFSHITAYVNMNITNLDLAVGDEVASVLISADANIASRYYYYVGGANAGTLEENSGQNAITVITNHADNIWFACAPMAYNTELTISVTTTNSKVYTKVIHTPAALAAGHVASFNVNFAGITPPEDKVYNLVTSYAELTAGSKVIIAAIGDSDYAAGIGTTSDNFITAVSQAKSADDSKITNPAATVDVFTIEAGVASNTIALNGTNGYLYAKSSSSNNMGIQTTNDVNGYWTPTITDAETGAMSLVAEGSSNHNHIRYNYNNGSPRFSCYASNSTLPLQALYKLEGSGSGSSLITTYTVTYNGNGNTGGSAPASVVTPGAFTVAAAGTLKKTGYNFNGWNTAADGSGTSYAAGAAAVATADLTLYAQWVDAAVRTEYTITWNSTNNSASISSYTDSWSVTADGLTCNMANFNNNKNGWNYVKCGRKNYASVATIITDSAISEAISSVTITIDAVTATKVNSIKLYISSNGTSWTEEGSFTVATGDQTVDISSPAASKYYKLEFDCASGSSNGLVTVSKLVFTI
jgi:uncharacterized repeat protein (TIGR02543 family)